MFRNWLFKVLIYSIYFLEKVLLYMIVYKDKRLDFLNF